MKVFRTTQELVEWRSRCEGSVGFVPTMGNLHEGHISLLQESAQQHPHSVLSIFVNPTQFGPSDDFNRYPRTLDADLAKVLELEKLHPSKDFIVWAPQDPTEIYPAGFATVVAVPELARDLEGALRPGHFEGVATVVYLLLHTVKPQTAYFGRKDYQQYRLVKRMARDLGLPVHIKGLPIIRDPNGLALSSRNQYLSVTEKIEALTLYRTLEEFRRRMGASAKGAEVARPWAQQIMQNDPRWQYLEIREARTLSTQLPTKGKAVILGVLKAGSVRLLDNLEMELV